MNQADKYAKEGRAYGFIDTDCGKPINQPFDAEALVNNFSKMHDCVSKTFKSFMSDLAEQEWVQ